MDKKPLYAALPAAPVLGLALLATLVLACRDGAQHEAYSGSPSALSVEEVFARAAAAMTRPGQVFHTTSEFSGDTGGLPAKGTSESWIDGERQAARYDTPASAETLEHTQIVVGRARYRPASEGEPVTKVEAPGCYGVPAALAVGCPGPTEESTKSVEAGSYDGKDAVVIVATGNWHGSDETFTFTRRSYLDSETFLPIATEEQGTADYGDERGVFPTKGTGRVRSGEFVPRDSLPDDFFDPASIGYVARNPEDGLEGAAPGITVYWLGRDFEGADGLPPLTLAITYVRDEPPSFRVSLEYKLAEEEFGTPAVALQEWDTEEWNAWLERSRGGNWWDGPCREKKELTVDGRRVVVHMGFEDETMGRQEPLPERPDEVVCPDAPYDRFVAHIYLDSTVVQMAGGDVCASAGCEDSPYDTLEGIKAIARALQPRP